MNKLEELIHHFKKTLSAPTWGPGKDEGFGRLFHANETIGIFFEIVLIAPIEAGWIWSKDIRKELMSFGAFFAFMVGLHKPAEQENV